LLIIELRFVGNSPIIAKDPDGKRIYYVNSNGEFKIATRAMVKTLSGAEVYLKYARSKTTDVYIGVANFGEKRLHDAETVPNAEKSNEIGISVNADSKLEISSNVSTDIRYNFSIFKNVDFSKSKGRRIALISISTEGLDKNDKYEDAFTIFHEIKAHVDINTGNGKKDHKIFGKEKGGLIKDEGLLRFPDGQLIPDEDNPGQFLKGEVVTPGSPADKMIDELQNMKIDDANKPK
jgi:hypothetical protein